MSKHLNADISTALLPVSELAGLRAQFPALQQVVNGRPLIYLDNAATTQKPHEVINAVVTHWQQHNGNVHRGSHRLSRMATSAFEAARIKVAEFINAETASQIIWTRGTTESINLLAYTLSSRIEPGDQVLITALEHHANIVPWQLLCQRTGAELQVVPLASDGRLDLEKFNSLLSERTRIFSLGHASNALGTINPVEQMLAAAKAAGAITIVDGAQAAAHLPIDVQRLNCDFYTFSGHKMFAPSGIGVLYGKRELLETLEPWQAGGEMIEKVSFSASQFQPPPFRFEAGTPNIEGAIGIAAAIEFMQAQPLHRWHRHECALRRHLYRRLQQLPEVTLYGPNAEAEDVVSLLSLRVAGLHSQDLGLLLDQQNVAVRVGHHCAMPLMGELGVKGTLRISLAPYNTLDEVNQVADMIGAAIAEHGGGAGQPHSTHASETMSATFSPNAWRWSVDELRGLITKAKGWEGRNRQLMLLAKRLPGLNPQQRAVAAEVTGCESQTWLLHQQIGEQHWFAVDSDARVVRGLLVLLLAAVNGCQRSEIVNFDARAWLSELGLLEHLSPSRGNGLLAIANAIQQTVK